MNDSHLDAVLKEVDAAKEICAEYKGAIKRILTVFATGKQEEERTYSIGQKVRIRGCCVDPHLLASCAEGRVVAIYPDGRRCTNSVRVADVRRITEKEMRKICGGYTWELVE